MFRAEHIAKRYGASWAVNDVSLAAEPGKTLALIGPSGCGKSTLLRMLVGLVTPTAGRITLDGEPIETNRWHNARSRIGYVIQDGGLFPHLTARQNALLPFRAADTIAPSNADLNDRLTELAELTHLDRDLLDRYPLELSGGQRQRVALIRALITDPELLLLDEPLGALDPEIRSGLQTELKAMFDRLGKAVLFVTHDLAEAAFLADELLLLREGAIEQRGAFAELLHRPASPFVERFVADQVDRVRSLLDGAAA